MKSEIKRQLLEKVAQELQAAEAAEAITASYAKDGDVKPDGKYDTRGIEAGYLAGAQSKRVEELKLEQQMIEETPIKSFQSSDEVGIGALVEIEFKNQTRSYFVCSTAGGTMLNVNGKGVLVISVFSPIGDAVVGCKVGEEFELETPQELRSYRVVGLS
jgi:transcription elongation GreA/GreB family factor